MSDNDSLSNQSTPNTIQAARTLMQLRAEAYSALDEAAAQATAGAATNPSAPANTAPVTAPNTTPASSSATANTPAASPGGRNAAWTDQENAACIAIMRAVINEGLGGVDARFDECSRRLLRQHGIIRSGAAVKNQWNRRLREQSGVEDRSRPYSGLTSTSLLGKKK